MTPDEKRKIKEFALLCGFTERVQPDGKLDLNPYVYNFALGMQRHGMERAASLCFTRAERYSNLHVSAGLGSARLGEQKHVLILMRDEADSCKTAIREASEMLGGS